MNGGFATIGHSNREPQTVIDMLRQAGVRLLVDVRSFPKSRTNPDFNDDRFPETLAGHQIGYRHMPALGGRRPKQPDVEAVWRRCHRRIITDWLLLHGHEVRHLMAPGRIDLAHPSEGARLTEDGCVIYPGPGHPGRPSADGADTGPGDDAKRM